MRVSFDLDDTLVVSPEQCKTEAAPRFPFSRIYPDRLRFGTVSLLRWMRKQGIELWIYTTSFRSERYIRGLFRCYGIKLDAVVNGERHFREVQAGRTERMPSKYPARYRIDLHIDDERSVAQNGTAYGFRVFLLDMQADDWVENIQQEIEKLSKSASPNTNRA